MSGISVVYRHEGTHNRGRAPGAAVTQVDRLHAHAAHREPSEAVAWLRANWVTSAALAVIAAQLYLEGLVLAHAYFRQDDFVLFDWALRNPLGWQFAGTMYGGHFMPGSLVLTWVLARVSLYDWTLASMVNLAIVAASGLALLRLLRTLVGSRPAILIPLAVYLFCPIMLPGLTFWATTLQWLPTQLAIFMAVTAQVHYVRSGRLRHAFAAAAWIAFGLLFDEVDIFIPVLLLALTSAFLLPGRWPQAIGATVRRYWRGFVLYLVLAGGYALVFLRQLHTSDGQPVKPGQFSSVLGMVSDLLRVSFVPSALGGPWHWTAVASGAVRADYAFAAESPPLTQISWSVAALIILASLWYRRHAWRAWAILAGWVFVSAVVPLATGRVGLGIPTFILGGDLHYLADSLPVLAVCAGLAFLPAAGEDNAYRDRPPRLLRQVSVAAVMALFLAGSSWSYLNYEHATGSAAGASYIATARAGIATAPAGAAIVDTQVPSFVEGGVFGPYAYTGRVVGPLAPALARLHWLTAPDGVYRNLMIVDGEGRLWRSAGIYGATVRPPAAGRGCWQVSSRGVAIPLHGRLWDWGWEMRVAYSGPAATLAVQFSGATHEVSLPAGAHTAWIPAPGAGSVVNARLLGGGPDVCVSSVSIGTLVASLASQPSPAAPVRG